MSGKRFYVESVWIRYRFDAERKCSQFPKIRGEDVVEILIAKRVPIGRILR